MTIPDDEVSIFEFNTSIKSFYGKDVEHAASPTKNNKLEI